MDKLKGQQKYGHAPLLFLHALLSDEKRRSKQRGIK